MQRVEDGAESGVRTPDTGISRHLMFESLEIWKQHTENWDFVRRISSWENKWPGAIEQSVVELVPKAVTQKQAIACIRDLPTWCSHSHVNRHSFIHPHFLNNLSPVSQRSSHSPKADHIKPITALHFGLSISAPFPVTNI